MRKTIYTVLAICCFCLINQNCSKLSEDSIISKQMIGEWHLTKWSGEVPTDMDIYLSFDADNSFAIYQRMESIKYQKYTGSFIIFDKVLSGVYSDSKPWGTNYAITIDSESKTLTLISTISAQDVGEYTRTPIPLDIKNGATIVKSTHSSERRWL